MNSKWLAIYLNDHLSGSISAGELTRRCLSHAPEGPLADFLRRFQAELNEERTILREVQKRLNLSTNLVKVGSAWVFEKAARLKLNSVLVKYTEYSRMMELEGLFLGVNGKGALWRALFSLQADEPRLNGLDFGRLEAQALAQARTLDAHRLEAAQRTFAPETSPGGVTRLRPIES